MLPPSITQVYERLPKISQLVAPAPNPPTLLDPTSIGANAISSPKLLCSSRSSMPPDRYSFLTLLTSLDHLLVPTSYSQASKTPCWCDAMNEELLALEPNSTWDLVPTP